MFFTCTDILINLSDHKPRRAMASLNNLTPHRGGTGTRAPGTVTINTLYRGSQREIVSQHVADIVRKIDAEILTANSAGKSSVIIELPTMFELHHLSKKDAQTLVYSEVLRVYKSPQPDGKGFEHTYIDIRAENTYLYIYWHNGMTSEERDERLKIIAESDHKLVTRRRGQ